MKDRLEQAEVLLKEFNEADDCLTEHSKDVSMKACEFQSDNYKLHCGIHVSSRELRGVRFQMAKCNVMNERLGKKNEERKKDNQSLGLSS